MRLKLDSLPKSVRRRKRLGRGPGSGTGKTAGKGHKGQRARSGGGVRPGFEGGQMPLLRRLPKRGFRNRFKIEYQVVNVSDLNSFRKGSAVDPASLREAGLISSRRKPVKILGNGELKKELEVKAHAFSRSAWDKITSAGGSWELIGRG